MTKAEVLLGGKTRFAVLEALADAEQQPITAYQIAMAKGLDPAATYRCLTELSEFKIVESESKERSNQTLYKLSKGAGRTAAEFLRSLKQQKKKTSKEPIDLEKWISPEMQAERMAQIVRLDQINTTTATSKFRTPYERKRRRQDVDELLSKRASGELSALITSSKIAFNELFEQKKDSSNTFILKT